MIKDIKQALDALLQPRYHDDAPGTAVLVAKNGEIVYEFYRGLADMQHSRAIGPDTVFNVASISKQFASVGVLKLVDKGLVSLDDSIAKYFPEFKSPHWQDIKLWHVMSHCSGVPDLRPRTDRNFMLYCTDRESLQYMEDLDTFHFAPGETYEYINPTYQLLFGIIERVSGMGFDEYQHKEIFEPLGMTSTFYFEPGRETEATAHGYIINEDTVVSGIDADYVKHRDKVDQDYVDSEGNHWAVCEYGIETFFATKADGGLYSTARDLLKWEKALAGNVLISEELKRKAYSCITNISASTVCGYQNRPNTWYGLGWFIDTTPGRERKVYHTGDNGGFQAYLAKFEQSDTVVVMLENCNVADRWSTQQAIEDIIL